MVLSRSGSAIRPAPRSAEQLRLGGGELLVGQDAGRVEVAELLELRHVDARRFGGVHLFDEAELAAALEEYGQRKRRFGMTPSQVAPG